MIVRANNRTFNFAVWSFMENQGDGSIVVHLPGVQVPIAFEDTSASNAVSETVLVEIFEKAAGLGVLTWDAFVEAYRQEMHRQAQWARLDRQVSVPSNGG